MKPMIDTIMRVPAMVAPLAVPAIAPLLNPSSVTFVMAVEVVAKLDEAKELVIVVVIAAEVMVARSEVG